MRSGQNILDDCLKLEKYLTSENCRDLDAHDLCSGLKPIAKNQPENTKPTDVLNYILHNNLSDIMPNLVIAHRIFLTFPVSVASGERSFSR